VKFRAPFSGDAAPDVGKWRGRQKFVFFRSCHVNAGSGCLIILFMWETLWTQCLKLWKIVRLPLFIIVFVVAIWAELNGAHR